MLGDGVGYAYWGKGGRMTNNGTGLGDGPGYWGDGQDAEDGRRGQDDQLWG